MVRAGRVAAAVGVVAGRLWICIAGAAQSRRQTVGLRLYDPGCCPDLLPTIAVFCCAAVLLWCGAGAGRRQRSESAAAVPGDGDSSSDAVPGLCGILGSLCLCAGRADDALPRRKVDQHHAPLDHGDVAVFDLRHFSRHALGLRRAGLGRLLGLGPGRERQFDAVADGYSISALRDDAGKARHDEELERVADLYHLHAVDSWYIADAKRTGAIRPRICRIVDWKLVLGLPADRAQRLPLYVYFAAEPSAVRNTSWSRWFSRESSFLFNNLVLLAACFTVLSGSCSRLFRNMLKASKVTVGPPFYNRVAVPIGIFLSLSHRDWPHPGMAQHVFQKRFKRNFLLAVDRGRA